MLLQANADAGDEYPLKTKCCPVQSYVAKCVQVPVTSLSKGRLLPAANRLQRGAAGSVLPGPGSLLPDGGSGCSLLPIVPGGSRDSSAGIGHAPAESAAGLRHAGLDAAAADQ